MPLLVNKPTKWVFIDKETGELKLSVSKTETLLIEGLIATIVKVSPYVKQYRSPLQPALKAIFTLDDGFDQYALWAGANSYLAGWICYAIINELFDVTLPITFTVKKTSKSQAIFPNIEQRGDLVIINKASLPLTNDGAIDWKKELLADTEAVHPMLSVIENVNRFILGEQEQKGISYPSMSHVQTNRLSPDEMPDTEGCV